MNVLYRYFLVGGLAGCAALLSGASAQAPGRSAAPKGEVSRPNVVLISMDDAGWHDFGFHGSDIRTPAIDSMARQGVEFTQFYASPTCTPTRAGLMTGRPPSRIGVTRAIDVEAPPPLPRDQITIAELMRRAGYDTAITGKWHLGNTLDFGPGTYGFRHSHGHLGPWVDFYEHTSMGGATNWHRNGEFIRQEGHSTDLIAGEAVEFITRLRDKSKPFFLYVSFNAPHLPLQEEPNWLELYRGKYAVESRRYYAAMVSHADDGIRRVLEALRRQGLAEDTLVFFFSDNGAEPPGKKEYIYPDPAINTTTSTGMYGSSGPLRGFKFQLYEGGVRVPAVAYWPGKLQPKRNHEALAIYDILPTVAAATGSPIPEGMKVEGVNFWPSVIGGGTVGERVIYWHCEGRLAVRKGDWKLIHFGNTPDEGEDELYNIAKDPYEKKNLILKEPRLAAALRQEMRKQYAMDPKG